jgi:hypothetical protein
MAGATAHIQQLTVWSPLKLTQRQPLCVLKPACNTKPIVFLRPPVEEKTVVRFPGSLIRRFVHTIIPS